MIKKLCMNARRANKEKIAKKKNIRTTITNVTFRGRSLNNEIPSINEKWRTGIA